MELHTTFTGHPEEEITVPVGATSASPGTDDAQNEASRGVQKNSFVASTVRLPLGLLILQPVFDL
jgi:hypothetical protein